MPGDPDVRALHVAAAELHLLLATADRYPAEDISDRATVAMRSIREAIAIRGDDSASGLVLAHIVDTILFAEDLCTVDVDRSTPNYALAFDTIETALRLLTAHLIAEPSR